MLRYLTLLLLTILFFSEATYSQSSSRIISIDEALSLTIQNNPTLKSSNTEIDISKALLRESKSVLYPQIESRVVVPFIGRESGFFLDQLIWDFGRTQNNIKSSKYNVTTSKYNYLSAKNNLIRDLKIKYYETVIAKNNLNNSEISIKKNEMLVEVTEELFNVDRRTDQELTQARIDLQTAQLNNLENQNLYKSRLLELANIMGNTQTGEFDVEDDLYYETNILNESEFLEVALSQNPQIKALVSSSSALESSRKAAKSNFMPLIFGRTAYRFEGDGADTPAFIAGIGIEYPIFQGFRRFAEVDRAEAEITRNNARLKEIKDSIELTVKKLYLELDHLQKSIDITKESKIIAEKNLGVAKERFDQKLASKIELAEAESSFVLSESNYKNSIYDYKIAKIRLLSLLGEQDQYE